MEISSHQNERPGNRDTAVRVSHNSVAPVRFISGNFPRVGMSVIASEDRDYYVHVTLEEFLRCPMVVPPEEIVRVVAKHCAKPEQIPDIVRAITAGGMKAAR